MPKSVKLKSRRRPAPLTCLVSFDESLIRPLNPERTEAHCPRQLAVALLKDLIHSTCNASIIQARESTIRIAIMCNGKGKRDIGWKKSMTLQRSRVRKSSDRVIRHPSFQLILPTTTTVQQRDFSTLQSIFVLLYPFRVPRERGFMSLVS